MKIKVRIEDVDLIIYEGTWDTTKQTTKIGVLPDDFEDDELIFEHDIDQTVYYWFTESEFTKAIDMLTNTHKLYPLDDGAFIYDMSNDDEPFEITLEEK